MAMALHELERAARCLGRVAARPCRAERCGAGPRTRTGLLAALDLLDLGLGARDVERDAEALDHLLVDRDRFLLAVLLEQRQQKAAQQPSALQVKNN